jgi:small basic protein
MYNYGWVPAMACMLGLAVWAFVRRVHAALVAALTACAVLFILDAIVGGVVSSLQTTWTIATSPAGLIALVLVVVVLFMGGGKSEGKPGVP